MLTAPQSQAKIEHFLLSNLIARESTAWLQIFAIPNQSLVISGNSYPVLNPQHEIGQRFLKADFKSCRLSICQFQKDLAATWTRSRRNIPPEIIRSFLLKDNAIHHLCPLHPLPLLNWIIIGSIWVMVNDATSGTQKFSTGSIVETWVHHVSVPHLVNQRGRGKLLWDSRISTDHFKGKKLLVGVQKLINICSRGESLAKVTFHKVQIKDGPHDPAEVNKNRLSGQKSTRLKSIKYMFINDSMPSIKLGKSLGNRGYNRHFFAQISE